VTDEGSEVDKIVVTRNDVKIIGYTDLPSRSAHTASNLYGNNLVKVFDDLRTKITITSGMNVVKFLLSMMKSDAQGRFDFKRSDPIVRNAMILDRGRDCVRLRTPDSITSI
jgi:NAD/NADP transhydrogenase alpha subunit